MPAPDHDRVEIHAGDPAIRAPRTASAERGRLAPPRRRPGSSYDRPDAGPRPSPGKCFRRYGCAPVYRIVTIARHSRATGEGAGWIDSTISTRRASANEMGKRAGRERMVQSGENLGG